MNNWHLQKPGYECEVKAHSTKKEQCEGMEKFQLNYKMPKTDHHNHKTPNLY